MGKKANKPDANKVVERVNKEFDKTSERLEKLINDSLKQVDGFQNQIQEPVRKLLREIDDLRNREVKRFRDEFDRRMDEFHELQRNVMDRLGISSDKSGGAKKGGVKKGGAKDNGAKNGGAKKKKAAGTSAKAKKATTKKPAAKKATAKKADDKKSATRKSTAAAKKPATAAKPAAAAKAADTSDLTRVKGIGPATAKKMKDAGITDISQIANPSAADEEKLAAFRTVKDFNTFSAEAKKVL